MDFTFTQSVTGAIQPYSNPKNIFKSAQSLIWPWPQSKNVSINGVILEIPSDPNLISHRAITPVLATKQSGVLLMPRMTFTSMQNFYSYCFIQTLTLLVMGYVTISLSILPGLAWLWVHDMFSYPSSI